jgi:hypothetical protein
MKFFMEHQIAILLFFAVALGILLMIDMRGTWRPPAQVLRSQSKAREREKNYRGRIANAIQRSRAVREHVVRFTRTGGIIFTWRDLEEPFRLTVDGTSKKIRMFDGLKFVKDANLDDEGVRKAVSWALRKIADSYVFPEVG